ncbi:hypothetical protein niasHT_017077 [Heterodera trifolii]|uniref:ShKT domain-containing protein n=1 Tax=Heterodera trifolii TaxID=157864 RepID=A0ABD2KZ46_9BILA
MSISQCLVPNLVPFLALFHLLFVSFFVCQINAVSDMDTLDRWAKDAAKLGLGQAELGAFNALREVLSSTDSKQILGMTANERGMDGADEAVRRRLSTIKGGVDSPRVRTLAELPKITLRAKKKLWSEGYDKETSSAEEDQDNAKRRVKTVLAKLEEGKESELFEKITPTDHKQLAQLDDTFTTKRFKDILTDLSRKSIVELPGGLSLALKDAAEYVIVAYSNLAIGMATANDLPITVKKAIEVTREVEESTTDDEKVMGGTRRSFDRFKSVDDSFRERIESLGLNDENVIALRGLVATLRLITLRKINMAYVELSKDMAEYKLVENGIKAMALVEQTVYDLDTFGLRMEPQNILDFDRQYLERAERITRNDHLKRHFGLRKRMEEAIKKLNNDFDTIVQRKTSLISGEPKTLWEKLAELDGKADLSLFGNPSDFEGLDSEYIRKIGEIKADSAPFVDYKGLKMRSEMAKQRLSRNYFLVADKKRLISAKEATQVQNAVRKATEILLSSDWEEMLGKPKMDEKGIEEEFKKRMEELNLEESEVKKMAGLSEALGEVTETLKLARQVLTERVRPPPPAPIPAETAPEETERRREEELQREYDNNPPGEISDECKDEAPNCRENIFLCKNGIYVTLMHGLCRKTCAVCMRTIEAAQCEDRNPLDCQLWGYSFCTNAAYSKGMKMAQCARFCGLCPK